MTKYVYICSPCRGDYENNIENAITYCSAAFQQGYIPIAPHIYFTRFVDDKVEEDRRRAMDVGKQALLSCSEVWIFGVDHPSEGMQEEIALAIRNGIPLRDGDKMISEPKKITRKIDPAINEITEAVQRALLKDFDEWLKNTMILIGREDGKCRRKGHKRERR